MRRPPSIIAFERLFWASIFVGVVSTFFAWDSMMTTLQRDSALELRTGATAIIVMLFIMSAISVAFWYGIARRASNVVKWIYVVWMGLGSISTITSLGDAKGLQGVALVMSLISTALTIGSIACLFRSDAVAWLTGKASVDPGIFD